VIIIAPALDVYVQPTWTAAWLLKSSAMVSWIVAVEDDGAITGYILQTMPMDGFRQ
jgi:hypothetical protein